MPYNTQQSDGYNLIMDEVRHDDIKYDPWGTAMAWLFAIADYKWAINGEIMPGYRPSPMGVDLSEEDYRRDRVGDFIAEDEATEDDLDAVYALLSRFADIAEANGRGC